MPFYSWKEQIRPVKDAQDSEEKYLAMDLNKAMWVYYVRLMPVLQQRLFIQTKILVLLSTSNTFGKYSHFSYVAGQESGRGTMLPKSALLHSSGKWQVILGGFLVHLVMGTIYMW